jgi:hypothetical protein
MKCCKPWVCALTLAMACVLRGQAYSEEPAAFESFESSNSIVRLAAGTAWNADPQTTTSAKTATSAAQEPVASPEPAMTDPTATTPSNAASCSTCGLCEDDCCCPKEHSLIASAEATFFWPQLNRGFLTSSADSGAGNVDFISNAAQGSVEGGLLVAPRITLGVQGCCWGLVTRYWYASPWATGFVPGDPAIAPAGVVSFDNFRAYTFDIEAQRRFFLGEWMGYGFFGARYAQVDNDRGLGATSLGLEDSVQTSTFASQQFGGTGITFGLWGLRPICCDSPLKYFVANRYSFLWGNSSAASQTSASVMNDTDGFATSTNGALAGTNQGDLFIAEIQLGLQWDAQLRCFPGRAFVRTALEYQYWDANGGLNTSADSFASVAGGGSATASASAGDLLFSLIGFNLGAGITY